MSRSLPISSLAPFNSTSRARLQALYSDIARQKHSNPTSYQSSLEWWRGALESIVWDGWEITKTDNGPKSFLTLNASRPLMERLKVEGVGKPLSLGVVVTELHRKNWLVSTSEFLHAKNSIYDPGWLPTRIAAFVIGKPVWWALEQLGVVSDEVKAAYDDKTWWGEYVVLGLVEKAANAIISHQQSKLQGPGASLYKFDSFRREFAVAVGGSGKNSLLTETDARVLLKFLERDRRCVVVDHDVIKFVDEHASTEAREISTVDRGILELKFAVENLNAQIDGIQIKIDESKQKASAALRNNRKPVALSYLRSRKQLEDLLNKRLGSLGVLEATLIRVEAAAGDIEIMKSYESSTATLRAILSHPFLQRDKIDQTMEAMAEATSDARELDDAIKVGGDVALGIDDIIGDDQSVEDELNKLVEEIQADKATDARDASLRKLDSEALKAPDSLPKQQETEVVVVKDAVSMS